MKRVRQYHVLFGMTLLALVALGTWWAIFFGQAVELEQRSRLDRLVQSAIMAASRMGNADQAPSLGPLSEQPQLEVISTAAHRDGRIFAPTVPRYADFGVRPVASALEALEERGKRRKAMIIGETCLLMILIGVLSFMLYRLVRQETRYLGRMEVFLSAVTHEMKAPLAGIKSMLQTFAAGRVPDGEQDKLYAMGLKEAERLEHIIENVLISGRLRAKRYQLLDQEIELFPLMEGFIEHRKRSLVGRPESIKLEWEEEESDLRIMGDQSALHMILENLTDNALKYGGAQPEVLLRVKREGERVCISVEDTGLGFPPEQAEKLFIPFRRELDSQQVVKHGTGLGLTIARALAGRMKGEIKAFSQGPGKGSQFKVMLREAV